MLDGGYTIAPPNSAPRGSSAAAGQTIWDSYKNDSPNLPTAQGSGTFKNPNGNSVPVTAKAPITAPSAGKALARFASKLIFPIQAGTALYDLLNELNVSHTFENGKNKFTETTQSADCPSLPAEDQGKPPDATCGGYGAGASGLRVYLKISPGGNQCMISNFCPGYGESDTRSLGPPLVGGGQPRDLTEEQLADKIAAKSGWPSTSSIARALTDATNTPGPNSPGSLLQTGPITVTGPSSSPGTTTTTTQGTGANATTTTATTTNNHVYQGDTVTTTVVTNTTTVNNTTGEVTNNTTSTVTNPANNLPAEKSKDPCGLPDTAKCKIDETGTPESKDLEPKKKVDEIVKPLQDLAKDPKSVLPQLPALNWSFRLPSGCVPISLPAFAPYLQDIDICPFAAMFHDIMSMVWVMGALFGAISTFWRNVFSQN